MNLVNKTGMNADLVVAIDPTGREHVVVIVKGTFLIPDDASEAVLAPPERQMPLILADTFTGAPGFSAPVYEAEFCLRKPRCDVLLLGTAYAPEGRPATRVKVGLKVGDWSKAFDVVGDRIWVQRGATLGPSPPQPFTTMPISYDRAFGGIDDTDPALPNAYGANPIGQGYGIVHSGARLLGRKLPNTEDPRDPVTVPWGGYRPMSFGPVGRGWLPRAPLAGTYDLKWVDETFPFLPADFDDQFFQAAPADQQIDEPRGGDPTILLNLSPGGHKRFLLPTVEVPVVFQAAEIERTRAVLDTVVIDADPGIITLVWRASRPSVRDLFEVTEILVGRQSRTWWRAREQGKSYYPSLGALIRERQRERLEEEA